MAENPSGQTNSTALIRTIGRWSLTALVINSIIGSGIFGLPADFLIESTGLLRAVHYGTHADDQWDAEELLRLAG